jgi:ankyrin repeat protein
MLIEKGADINAQNFQGCTPLHWVSGAGSVPMVKFLLDEGTHIDIMDNSGRTAIDRARETRDEHLMKLLQLE